MDFASGYIFEEGDESTSEEESDDAEEDYEFDDGGEYSGGFECEIMDFDEDDKASKGKKSKGISTNTVNLELVKLKEKSDAAIPDTSMYTCSNGRACGAILSHIDKPVEQTNSSEKIWRCRFCGVEKVVQNWPDFKEGNDIIYCKDPNSLPDLEQDPGDNTVIFVLDTSGSMVQSVEGRLPNTMMTNPMLSQMLGALGGGFMGMINSAHMGQGPMPSIAGPSPSTSNNDKTRLEALRDVVVKQIKNLKANSPKTRVGVVIFNDDVTVIGDGSKNPDVVPEHILNDYSLLLAVGQRQVALEDVGSSCDKLTTALKGLKEEGRTALGPALVIAMAMASKCKTSKVILCTDGYANVGLGRLEDSCSKDIDDFYSDVSAYCKLEGVSVSLISFDNCGMAEKLGELPVETGGTVCKINPKDADAPIGVELTTKTMAKNAFVRFVVHKQMYIEEGDQKRSNMKHLVGNLHDKMKQVFKFSFRKDDASKRDRQQITEHRGQISEKPKRKVPKIIDESSGSASAKPDEKQQSADPAPSGTGSGASQSVQNPNANTTTSDPNKSTDPDKKLSPDNPDKPPSPENPNSGADLDIVSGSAPGSSPALERPQGNGDGAAAPSTSQQQEQKDEPTSSDGKDDSQAAVVEEFPFQVQIYFEDLRGTTATRVWTNVKPVTTDRQQAVQASNMRTTVSNMIQQSAKTLLEVKDKKVSDMDLKKKADELRNEINNMLKLPNLDPEESKVLNEYQKSLNKIASEMAIDDDVATALRNFQQGKIFATSPA